MQHEILLVFSIPEEVSAIGCNWEHFYLGQLFLKRLGKLSVIKILKLFGYYFYKLLAHIIISFFIHLMT